MQQFIGYFTPTLDQLVGLGALLVVCAGLVSIGGAMRGRKRLFETDLIAGWAVASVTFTAAGGLIHVDFRWIALALLVATILAGIFALVRDRRLISPDMLRALAISLPLLWLAACMTISQWDEFMQWMPNARYIFEYNTFPRTGNPPTSSVLPAYPHGVAYVVYLSSRLTGFLAENTAAAFNIVLLACFAMMIGRMVRMAITGHDGAVKIPIGLASVPSEKLGWLYCAIGALAVTGLNPTFVPKIVFTAYSDASTAVLVGMLCIVMWMILNVLSGDEKGYSPGNLAWSYGLIAVALVSVKQPNIVLFALVTIGGAGVALRDRDIPFMPFVRLLPAIILPPVTMYILWRLHVSINEVGTEVEFLPRAEWLTDRIGAIAAKMASIAAKKGGYFSVMLISCVFAVRALWRMRTPFDRLSLIIAVTFVGYTGFLLFLYVTAFGEGGARDATSYWRFNMHLGGACVTFGAYGVALLWRTWITPRLRRNISWIVFALIVIGPFALAHKIRFDQHPVKIYVRQVVEDLVAGIPEDTRLGVLDPTGNGEFAVIARYVATRHTDYVGHLIAAHRPTAGRILEFIDHKEPEMIWVHVPTESAERALAVRMIQGSSYLLKHTAGKWVIVKSWPYPGYADPNTVPK